MDTIPSMYFSNEGKQIWPIVNVSSGPGSLNYMAGGTPTYSISKAVLNAFSCILRQNLVVLELWLIPLNLDGYSQIWAAMEDAQ
jgi:short-subunit dehydrogenase involved in D-alanine esterification of teichoic acids